MKLPGTYAAYATCIYGGVRPKLLEGIHVGVALVNAGAIFAHSFLHRPEKSWMNLLV